MTDRGDGTITIKGPRLVADLKALARFGQVGTGVNRPVFTPDDVASRHWLLERMQEAGLDAVIDGIGNVYGQTPNVSRSVLIGSHTDSVPNGGWLDGALGVLYGLEIARALIESGAASDAGVDVISFADEEGRFQGTVGSRVFCGEVAPADCADVRSADGTTLAQALEQAGFAGRPLARLDPARHRAYFEAHIEQGPRLEAEAKRIGVVTAIVGIRRARVTFGGQADHAGTTPMDMRRDAGSALIEFGHDVAARFRIVGSPDSVWNFGSANFEPGAANVVPSGAELAIEYRDASRDILDRLEQAIAAAAETVNDAGKVSCRIETVLAIEPTTMDETLGKIIKAAADAHRAAAIWMPSGAGHDAMALGRHLPTAMLFIPSIGGRSHDIAEDTDEADIVLGAEVLAEAVARLCQLWTHKDTRPIASGLDD